MQGNLTWATAHAGGAPPAIGLGWEEALGAIDGIAAAMERINGRRKVLVLVSDGWKKKALRRTEFQDTVRLATAANLSIYPIDPTGIPNDGDVVSRMSAAGGARSSLSGATPNPVTIRAMAVETGGVSGNSNNFDGELARIEEDAGTYYLLGFTPSTVDTRRGHTRRLRVRVKRRDLIVQSRTAYSQAAAVHPFDPRTASLYDVATAALPVRDLPLTARATRGGDGGHGQQTVVATVDVRAPAAMVRGRTLHYTAIAANEFGRVVDSTDGVVSVPDTPSAAVPPIVAHLHLHGDFGTIKVVVRADDGLTGSVFLNVN